MRERLSDRIENLELRFGTRALLVSGRARSKAGRMRVELHLVEQRYEPGDPLGTLVFRIADRHLSQDDERLWAQVIGAVVFFVVGRIFGARPLDAALDSLPFVRIEADTLYADLSAAPGIERALRPPRGLPPVTRFLSVDDIRFVPEGVLVGVTLTEAGARILPTLNNTKNFLSRIFSPRHKPEPN